MRVSLIFLIGLVTIIAVGLGLLKNADSDVVMYGVVCGTPVLWFWSIASAVGSDGRARCMAAGFALGVFAHQAHPLSDVEDLLAIKSHELVASRGEPVENGHTAPYIPLAPSFPGYERVFRHLLHVFVGWVVGAGSLAIYDRRVRRQGRAR